MKQLVMFLYFYNAYASDTGKQEQASVDLQKGLADIVKDLRTHYSTAPKDSVLRNKIFGKLLVAYVGWDALFEKRNEEETSKWYADRKNRKKKDH